MGIEVDLNDLGQLARPCQQCGAPWLVWLGQLGSKQWFRCRACGWTQAGEGE